MGEHKTNPVAQFARMMPGDPWKGKKWGAKVVPLVAPKENVVVYDAAPPPPEEGKVYYKLGERIRDEDLDVVLAIKLQIVDPTIAISGPRGEQRFRALEGDTPFIIGRLDYLSELRNVEANFGPVSNLVAV